MQDHTLQIRLNSIFTLNTIFYYNINSSEMYKKQLIFYKYFFTFSSDVIISRYLHSPIFYRKNEPPHFTVKRFRFDQYMRIKYRLAKKIIPDIIKNRWRIF